MGWPTPQEYNEAIQNPRSAFEDAELRAGQPVMTPLGLPRPITGAFASVYQMVCANQRTYAVRCFLREFGDQQDRYAAISAHLARVRLPYMTNFTYLANGIRVNGRWYPILKMEWLEGEALQAYVERNLDQPPVLLNLAEQWVQMAKLLRSAAIGHGDLQHGNVIVTGGQLRLIDYDGMYVPALAGRQSHEIGHRNYQHPQRSERQFDPAVDHFSTWVVYTSLVALSVQPQLWRTYGGGDECLLFRREDFERPAKSGVLRSLEASPDARLRSLGSIFASLPLLPPDRVPPIDGTLSAAPVAVAATGVVAGAAANDLSGSATPAGTLYTGATSDWLLDHVSAPVPTPAKSSTPGRNGTPARGTSAADPNGHVASEAASADNGAGKELVEEPSWIRDFIGVQQTEPVDFDGDVTRQRLFVYVSVMAAIAAWLGVQWIGASLLLPAAMSAAALVGSLAVLADGYRQDASVQAQGNEWRKLGEIDRQIRSAKKRRRRLQRKQGRLRAAEVKRREKLEQRLKQSQSAEAVDLQHLDQKLQADLARVQRRRDGVRQVGVDAVNKLQAKHATYLASLDNQIGGLRQLEEAELAQTLKRRQQQFVAAYMKRQTIEAAIIPGIGPAAKESLRKQGILRAQDLEAPRLAQIEGIGEAKARVLLEWRRKAESLALQASPQNLSKIEETLIRGRFFQRRFALEQEKVKAQRKLAKDVTAAQEQNAGQLKAIDQEPQTLRTRAAQQRDAIRKRHQGQRTQWQSALSALNGAGQATGMSPEETLVEQELALLTAQRSSAELRLRRYESLAFGSYVRRVVGMR